MGNSSLELALLYIAVLIVVSRVLGEAFLRIKQPAIIGELLAGMILGPMMFGFIEVLPEIELFILLGVYFLIFLAGYEEINVEELVKAMRIRVIASSMISFFTPFTLCLLVFSQVMGMAWAPSLLLSSVMALTSLGVVVRIVSDLRIAGVKLGLNLINMSILSEFMGLLIASASTQMLVQGEQGDYAFMAVKVLSFFLTSGLAGYFLVPRLIRRVERIFKVKAASFATLIAIVLLFSYLSSLAGLHGVFGALIMGFALSRTKWDPVIRGTVDQLKGFAYGIFIPLFFAGAGLYVTRDFMKLDVLAAVAVALAVVVGKLVGGFVSSKLMRVEHRSLIALGQLAKGGVEIAILSFALSIEAVSIELYSYIVLLIFFLTIAASTSLNLYRRIA
ncbi:MAG: hypothetical protein DRJ62_00775 [Thermoprotei archaeon]|nr:MAG: hypothetical protein DRJ62_00775 [Thermoprotei archaeon]